MTQHLPKITELGQHHHQHLPKITELRNLSPTSGPTSRQNDRLANRKPNIRPNIRSRLQFCKPQTESGLQNCNHKPNSKPNITLDGAKFNAGTKLGASHRPRV